MIPLTTKQVVTILIATPNTLRQMLAGLDDDMLCYRPAENEWSTKEIIGHLIETDIYAFQQRIQQILNEDHPQLISTWNMNQSIIDRQDNSKSITDLLNEFEAPRLSYTKQIENLTRAQMARSASHPIGQLAVSDFVFEWPFHDMNHIQQIANNLKAYIHPYMGEVMRNAVS